MDQFKDYIGKKIGVQEKEVEFSFKGSTPIKFTECHLDENEPTIAALEKEWSGTSHKFRVWLPNTMGTMDYWADRLNVYIEKNDDGDFVIKRFATG